MIDVRFLLQEADGAQEEVDFVLPAETFPELPLKSEVQIKGRLLRVQEGISFLLDEVSTSYEADCVVCQKKLTLSLASVPTEWLFYEKKPRNFDDPNELVLLDMKYFTLDPTEVLRQEIVLNMPEAPRCAQACGSFQDAEVQEAPKGVKGLAGLKDLMS